MNNNELSLQKILKDQCDPDEKIVYVARFHWTMLAVGIICFILLLTYPFCGGNISEPSGILIFLLIFLISAFHIFFYHTGIIVVTNKRCIPTSIYLDKIFPFKAQGYLLNKIKSIRSYEGLFGAGNLYIERKDFPHKILASPRPIRPVKNVKELESKIIEQLRLIDNSAFQ